MKEPTTSQDLHPFVSLINTFLLLMINSFIAGRACNRKESKIGKIEQTYIDQSYYDLRNEAKRLNEPNGLTQDDSQVKRDALIEQKREDFRDKYIGKYVRWTGGYISDIEKDYGRFLCKIEMNKDTTSTVDITIPLTKQQAMNLKKDKEVLIDGKINSLSGSLKVGIKDAELSYTGRNLNEMREETKPQAEETESGIEFRTAGYYKSDNRHRIFAKYPSKTLDRESIPDHIWDKVVQVGLNEMYTAGKTTRVFFYIDETSALKARLNQHTSYDAALNGAYYAKPFAAVKIMFNKEKWFTKYPETPNQETIKMQ